MLTNLAASAAAHVSTYVAQQAPSVADPKPPTLDFNAGTADPGLRNFLQNLMANGLLGAASIAFLGFLFLVIGTFVFNKKWGSKSLGALIIAVICIAPAVFFESMRGMFTSLNG